MRASKASLSPPAPASSAAVSEGRVFLPAASVPARSEHVRARTLSSGPTWQDLSVSGPTRETPQSVRGYSSSSHGRDSDPVSRP